MIKGACWALLVATLPTPFSAAARQPPDSPILRIETGSHSADVTGLALDANARSLATSSYDKTVRIWSPDDPHAPARVIRVPIDADREGGLYAVALSPDGRVAVTGGWTGGWDGGAPWSLYVLDTASGGMTRRISSLPGRMESLVFSRSGEQLAIGLKNRPGIILFDTRDWSIVASDFDYSDDVPSIDMDARGRIAALSLNGEIAVYDAGLQRKRLVKAPGGRQPAVARFSPDGSLLAVGYSDSPRVDLLSGEDLSLVASADSRGVDKGFIALAWSADGDHLYAAGYYNRGGRTLIRRWSNAGRGPARDFPAALAVISRLQAFPDGRLAFTTESGAVVVLDASMRVSWERRPGTADFRDQSDTLRVSSDGRLVEFAYDRFGSSPLRFSLGTKSLSLGDLTDTQLAPALTEAPEINVQDWRHSERPTLNDAPLQLRPHDESLTLAIAPDRRSFVLGTSWRVIRFDASGTPLWDIQAPGATWAVVVSQNGQLAVAAFSDGTIRWLSMADGQFLLTLFSHAPTHHWVAWTQSGYYVASSGGDSLIGWHVNRGEDQAADFFPVGHFRDIYYRPDVVEKVLGALDEGGALRHGDLETGRSSKEWRLGEFLPPVVTAHISSSDSHSSSQSYFSSPKVTVSYRIRRTTAHPISALEVRADGRPVATITAASGSFPDSDQIDVYVPRRDTVIEVIARSTNGIWSEPAVLRLRWDGPGQVTKPSLFVLAIGISDYAIPELRLKLPAKDAADFRAVFERQRGKAYRNVELVTLTNEQATGDNLQRALDWLASAPTSRDVAMLFIAGHGVDDAGGQYFFVPQEVSPKEAVSRGLPYRDIRNALQRVAGRVFLFIDTCHSGAAWGSMDAAAADISRIVNDLKSPEYGIVTFASSTGRQVSYESAKWGNGAFTKAVVEALSGQADFFGNGYVSVTGLEAYVADRVPKLTDGRQTPAIGRPLMSDVTLVSLR
jgi:WD40 repeat protein